MNNSTQKTPLLAWILLVALALVWGSSFILMKKSLEAYSVVELGAGRLFLGTIFFIPLMFKAQQQVPRNRYPYLLASALIGYIMPAFIFALAGTKLNSSLSGMLNSTSPLWTLVLGILFFKQKTKGFQVVGILVGLLGAVLLILSKSSSPMPQLIEGSEYDNPYLYALLIMFATMLYGLNTNNIVKNLNQLPPLASAAMTFVFIGPICFLILLNTDFFSKFFNANNWHSSFFLSLLGLLGSGLTSFLYNKTVQISSGLFASSVTYLIPIVAIFWGVLDGEKIVPQHFLGMGVILTGIYLVNKK